MKIQDLFEKDINRKINGVVKVSTNDEESIRQELSEYVVTRELQKHFANFFESYTAALDVQTDRIGVWISGFFGSGKSHFLKMLSYVLENNEVAGKQAIDYFEGKVPDAMVYSQMKRACSVPTEAILFNIDDKASQWKEGATAKTALLRAFARVFYEHRGFYGADLKLARLEEFIDEQGKTDEFRAAFARVNGGDWVQDRSSYDFYEDDIVEVLQEVLGWSEQQARRTFDKAEDDAIAPADLVQQIGEYVERRASEEGGDFRLLFMVDEVGQFIGADVDLMLNLQTIVEDLGARCGGRVWVMVTSQEAIDEVTKVVGTDFSKIQGRFNTRLSLSSSSVDEVIKRRVLDKTEEAQTMLESEYGRSDAVLKNLFSFESSTSDLVGYKNAGDFQETYPFVGYQFTITPKVLAEIRRHGHVGRHLSGGERSMLSCFQIAAQSIEDCSVSALVPYWRFYDALSRSMLLEHDICQVIDRCQRASEDGLGIEPIDVEVLKTLYLIRYINDVKPTVGNIAILMVDDMNADKVSLHDSVATSLARLVRENYVSRTGDTYHFLTNEEQDIAREIKSMSVEPAAIIERIKSIIFDDVYTQKKARGSMNDYPVDCYVDGAVHGAAQGGMRLNVLTVADPLCQADDKELMLRSLSDGIGGQALVALSGAGEYYESLSTVAQIDKFIKTKNMQALPESTQCIIAGKQKEAHALKREAKELLEQALCGARCAIAGQMVEIRAANARDKIDEVLARLSRVVYKDAGLIDVPLNGEADIIQILKHTDQRGLAGVGGGNERADAEVMKFLDAQAMTIRETAMSDLQRRFGQAPFGWREIDVAGCVARLIADQRVQVFRAGVPVDPNDTKLVTYLTKRSEADKLKVSKREKIDEVLLRCVRKLLQEMPGVEGMIPEDEDGLAEFSKERLGSLKDRCEQLIKNEYQRNKSYPGRPVVDAGARLIHEALSDAVDVRSLFSSLKAHEGDLLDFAEDFEDIEGFFPSQQRLFDEACALDASIVQEDLEYLKDDADTMRAIEGMRSVLGAERPYGDISKLSGLMQTIKSAHQKLLSAKKGEMLDYVNASIDDVSAYGQGKDAAQRVLSALDAAKAQRRSEVNAASTLTKLDALNARLTRFRDEQYVAIDAAEEAATREKQRVITSSTRTDGSTGDKVTTVRMRPEAAQAPAPQTKVLLRNDLCPAYRLTSTSEVDEYVERIRRALLDAIAESGSVRLG